MSSEANNQKKDRDFEENVLPEEIKYIKRRREHLFQTTTEYNEQPPNNNNTQVGAIISPVETAKNDFRDAHAVRPFGVALSGGGIRSATLNLGIIQGLTEKGLLPYIDYLSTVSGGGYIGAWLHGLIKNRYNGNPQDAEKSLSPQKHPIPGPPDDDPISFLRKYSNYLAPRAGLFSADSWVIAVIWLRNVLLNQLIMLPALSVAIITLLLIGVVEQYLTTLNASMSRLPISITIAVFALLLAAQRIGPHVYRIATDNQTDASNAKSPNTNDCSYSIIIFILLAGALIGYVSPINKSDHWLIFELFFGLSAFFALIIRNLGYIEFIDAFRKRHKAVVGYFVAALAPFVAGCLSTFLIIFLNTLVIGEITHLLPSSHPHVDIMLFWAKLSLAPPLVYISITAGTFLLVGLIGEDLPDAAREWIARIEAMVTMLSVTWGVLFGLGVWGPYWIAKLLANYSTAGTTAIGAWVLTTAAGVLTGQSASTNGQSQGTKTATLLKTILHIAPTIFMIGYILLVSSAVHIGLSKLATPKEKVSVTNAVTTSTEHKIHIRSNDIKLNSDIRVIVDDPEPSTFSKNLNSIASAYFGTLTIDTDRPWVKIITLIGFILASVIITLVASFRFNINEFSLHNFYKNRLVRCYLGASRSNARDPDSCTGFDPNDDFPLTSLNDEKYCGPYAIINTALNLNVGSELAEQERKAQSFIFTPKYCGFKASPSKQDELNDDFDVNGYTDTKSYTLPDGPLIGTAMAISGAAANPNQGYSTSGPVAFLMTVFDARLGSWLGNPRWKKARATPGPDFALWYLFMEMFGLTNARTKYVNLSDGGHFDNLGLYELVRRRCRYIIVGDGEQDGDLTFGSLGAAIRKCRADFGVEIDINPKPIRLVNGYSTTHCAVGTITYPEDETGFSAGAWEGDPEREPQGKAKGWILYLKSSLSGDEPTDVIEYNSRHKAFPHEPTADQFFSESQFESYRRLGLHIVDKVFEGVKFDPGQNNEGTNFELPLLKLFQSLTRKWYPPLPVTPEAASRLADHYSQLMRQLASDQELAHTFYELLPNVTQRSSTDQNPRLSAKESLFGLEVIQLIENVYTEFQFEHKNNRDNPRNAGWMGVFVRWVKTDILFNQIWEAAASDYNPLFRQFMQELRDSN